MLQLLRYDTREGSLKTVPVHFLAINDIYNRGCQNSINSIWFRDHIYTPREPYITDLQRPTRPLLSKNYIDEQRGGRRTIVSSCLAVYGMCL